MLSVWHLNILSKEFVAQVVFFDSLLGALNGLIPLGFLCKMSGTKRQYSWETDAAGSAHGASWEGDSSMTAWKNFQEAASDDDSMASEKPADPAQELVDYLIDQHNSGALSAKQVCIISYWAGQAGVDAAKPLGLPPWTKGSGDFKRLLDKKVPSKGPSTYRLAAPCYSRKEGTRAPKNLAVLLPHEMLQVEMQHEDMEALQSQWQAPPNFQEHPVVKKAAETGVGPVIPISLFIDGVAYAKRDSLLCVTVQNLWTGHRFVICALRKRILCKCGCKGWDTLHAMFLWLRWALNVLATGCHPERRHDGDPWEADVDVQRLAAAGQRLPFLAAVAQLRADWAEIAHTMAVPQWSSHSQPCFLCRATDETAKVRLAECDFQSMVWELKTGESYEAACSACEIWVDPLSKEDGLQLRELLEADHRPDGARGFALQKAFPKLMLKKGDRLEPTADLWDTQQFFEGDPPSRVLFWRRAAETATLRRNPLFCKELGLDLSSVVALDAMHTLCLGVHQQLVLEALWSLIDGWVLPAEPTGSTRPKLNKVTRHERNMGILRGEYKQWLQQMKKDQPNVVLTAVGDLTLDLLGKFTAPVLRTKAHETLTLLRWLADLLPKYQDGMQQGHHWAGAAQSLVRMWALMDEAPLQVSAAVQKESNEGCHQPKKKGKKKLLEGQQNDFLVKPGRALAFEIPEPMKRSTERTCAEGDIDSRN